MSPSSPRFTGVAGLSTPAVDPRVRPSDRAALAGGPRGDRTVLTRRYEFQWLGLDGYPESGTRVAPATPAFEDAFGAFGRGTLISTSQGPIAVEDLVPGALVETIDGHYEQLLWAGSMTLIPSLPDSAQAALLEPAKLTRISTDTFGNERPGPDLLLGPRARLLYNNTRCREILGASRVFAPARGFVDGVSVVEITPASPIRVFHLALSGQNAIYANGLAVESYHPGLQANMMMSADMQTAFMSMFPHIRDLDGFGAMPIPRLTAFELENVRG